MTSHPVGNKTSFSQKQRIPDKKKELGYMRKDFDPDQLRLLLIYRPRKDG